MSATLIIIGFVLTIIGIIFVMLAALIVTTLWAIGTAKEYTKDSKENDDSIL